MAESIMPQHIGDVYRVDGYPHEGAVSYGWATERSEDGHVLWMLRMADGDGYGWIYDVGMWDMPGIVSLVRRNPLRGPHGCVAETTMEQLLDDLDFVVDQLDVSISRAGEALDATN